MCFKKISMKESGRGSGRILENLGKVLGRVLGNVLGGVLGVLNDPGPICRKIFILRRVRKKKRYLFRRPSGRVQGEVREGSGMRPGGSQKCCISNVF